MDQLVPTFANSNNCLHPNNLQLVAELKKYVWESFEWKNPPEDHQLVQLVELEEALFLEEVRP